MENSPNRPSYEQEDFRSKNVKAKLGATALEIRQFLMQDDEQIKSDVKEAEGYHNLVDSRINHLREPETPEHFVDWQAECFEKIKHEKNVILSAPTGSGKTQVFMEWAKEKQKEAKEDGKRSTVYITAPIKALSNQRSRELEQQGYKVGLETGDVKNVPEDADYICCTQEIFTNKYCEDVSATLIIDEFHYIFENQDRSRAYIDGIHDTKAKNVLICSATFGDMAKLTDYVDKTSSRDFSSYESHERLTELDYEGYLPAEKIKDALVVSFSANRCEEIANDLSEFWDDAEEETIDQIKAICEKHKVKYDPRFAKGIATYYGRKLPKTKLCIEELFEKRLIDTVVGTDALALGVNFPVEKVVFTDLAKFDYYNASYGGAHGKIISKNLFDQLAGRAGRKGFFHRGAVYYNDDWPSPYGFDTKLCFSELTNKKNEDINIELKPKLSRILSGQTTIEEEVSYIEKYSTGKPTYSSAILDEIGRALHTVQTYKVRENDPTYGKEFTKQEFDYITQDIQPSATGAHPLREHGLYAIGDEYDLAKMRPHDTSATSPSYAITEDESISLAYSQGSALVGFFDLSKNAPTRREMQTDGYRCIYDTTEKAWRLYEPVEMLSGQKLSDAEAKTITDKINAAYNEACQLDKASGMRAAEVHARHRQQEALNKQLQKEFDENISRTYNDAVSPLTNCRILSSLILGEDPLDKAFSIESFSDLLRAREVLLTLPRQYRKKIDFAKLDQEINSIDETALNQGRGLLGVEEIKANVNQESEAA